MRGRAPIAAFASALALLLVACAPTVWSLRFPTNLAASPNPSNPSNPSNPFRFGGSQRFEGGLLGVSADVVLHRDAKVAVISLSGVPIGGRVEGKAELGSGEDDVVIHEPLRGVLARRFVKIVSARHDAATDRVLVTARLPLGLGTHTIVLERKRK